MNFSYKVKGVRLVEGSILEVDLTYCNPNLPDADSCEKEATNIGLDSDITVYHTGVNYQPAVGHIVGVQFVYEDIPFFGEDGQPKNKQFQLIEYQQLL